MLAALERLPPRAVVLLHASCHNPTGADLSPAQWRELLAVVKRRQLLPFIDMAYQGLGDGLEADAFALRLFCAELPEVLCAVSCSKNFGLYRERTGALHVVSEHAGRRGCHVQPAGAHRARHLVDAAGPRRGHRARHPRDETLRAAVGRRKWTPCAAASRACGARWCSSCVSIARSATSASSPRQRGMFSYFGISTAQVRELRERHHVYMTDDSRMNIAGLRQENLEYFARAVAQVLDLKHAEAAR